MATRWRVLTTSVGMRPVTGPRVPAVYAVYLDGLLAYIGSTCNLADRLSFHQFRGTSDGHSIVTPWGQYARFALKYKKSSRYGDWLMDEARLIRRLGPSCNVAGRKRVEARMIR